MALTQAIPPSPPDETEPPGDRDEKHRVPLDLDGPEVTAFTPFELNWPDRGIVAHFLDVAGQRPDADAIVEAGTAISYATLAARVFELAGRINNGVSRPGAVGIVLRPSSLFWTAILGCLAAQRPYVALDIRHPTERNADIIRTAGLAAVITPSDFDPLGEVIPANLPRIDPEVVGLTVAGETILAPPAPIAPESPAAILFTSGSTGRPKGIANNEGALLLRVAQHVNAAHLNADDRFLTLSSPCTIAGTREGLAALLIGASLHVADLRDGGLGGIARLIKDARITILNAVPSVLRALFLDQPDMPEASQSLRILRIGGENLFWSDIKLFRGIIRATCHIHVAYSSTESTGTQWFVPPDAVAHGMFVPAGYLLPGVAASIVNEAGEPTPVGEVGELVLRGPFIALGVWEEGTLRPGSIRSDPADPNIRVIHTGDLASVQENGLYTIVGRKDRQVKINGMRVEPAEIEGALRNMPEIADAAVFADKIGKATNLTAFVVFHAGAGSSIRSVRAALRATLPPPMRPSRIVSIDAIPRLPSGKQDAAALARLNRETEAATVKQKDETPHNLAGGVRRVWSGVLGTQSLAAGVSFEEAGGDSLKMLQLVLGLEKFAGRRLALDLFGADTRLEDVIRIVGQLTDKERATDPLDRRPGIFLLPGLDGDELRLAAFRGDLSAVVRFTVVDYPDWTETAVSGSGFDMLIASAVAQIVAEQPAGPIRIAGYSYGGDVGFAAASRLIALGREVAFLGILDTDLCQVTTYSGLYGQNRMQRQWHQVFQEMAEEGRGTVLGFLLAKCARDVLGLERVARHERFWRWLLPRRTEFAFDRRMRRISRLREQWRWHERPDAPPIATPTTLFRSRAHDMDSPPDLNWIKRCQNLSVVAVEGDHRTMLDPPNRATLCHRFAEAVERSMGEQYRDPGEGIPETEDRKSQLMADTDVARAPP